MSAPSAIAPLIPAVAYAYGVPADDVATWPPTVIRVFHRVAARRGLLTPTEATP